MEEERINTFRDLIRQLKEATVYGIVYETQDVSVLNDVQSRLIEIYKILRDALRGEQISNSGISKLFAPIFTPPPTEEEAAKMIYYARRDLIMFPLTFDSARINSVDSANSMKGKIIARKE